MAVFTHTFTAIPLPEVKEIPSDTPPHDSVTLSRYRAVIDGEIRTLCLDFNDEVKGYIGDSRRFTPPLSLYASGQERDKGGREPCKCEIYGYCICSIVVGAIKGSCLVLPCEHGCMDGCPCQTCAGRKFVKLSQQGEIWAFEESILAWVDDDGNVRIRRTTTNPIKLKIALPYDHLEYRSIDAADFYHCNRCRANIIPFLRFDELVYVGTDTHGVPLFHDCSNCGLESGGIIGGMSDFTDDANTPPLATWDGVRTNRPRVEKSKARIWEKKSEHMYPNRDYSHIESRSYSTSTVFISYSRWENGDHSDMVRYLVDGLRSSGVEVTIDEDIGPGGDILRHMESLTAHDFVLVICSPSYKERYKNRTGGVGVEGRIIANAILQGRISEDHVIPVLLNGDFKNSIPEFLPGIAVVDLSDGNTYSEEYLSLLHRVGNHQS